MWGIDKKSEEYLKLKYGVDTIQYFKGLSDYLEEHIPSEVDLTRLCILAHKTSILKGFLFALLRELYDLNLLEKSYLENREVYLKVEEVQQEFLLVDIQETISKKKDIVKRYKEHGKRVLGISLINRLGKIEGLKI
jgi:hypothetical protein